MNLRPETSASRIRCRAICLKMSDETKPPRTSPTCHAPQLWIVPRIPSHFNSQHAEHEAVRDHAISYTKHANFWTATQQSLQHGSPFKSIRRTNPITTSGMQLLTVNVSQASRQQTDTEARLIVHTACRFSSDRRIFNSGCGNKTQGTSQDARASGLQITDKSCRPQLPAPTRGECLES